MSRPEDELALYEAIHSGRSAGAAEQFAADRDRVARIVARLHAEGWELRRTDPEPEEDDPNELTERIRQLEDELERHDIEVPLWE